MSGTAAAPGLVAAGLSDRRIIRFAFLSASRRVKPNPLCVVPMRPPHADNSYLSVRVAASGGVRRHVVDSAVRI